MSWFFTVTAQAPIIASIFFFLQYRPLLNHVRYIHKTKISLNSVLETGETTATLIAVGDLAGVELYDLNGSLIAGILDAMGLTRS